MTSKRRIDLNADLGEFPGEVALARDAQLMKFVTSANVACGGHAGDESTIRRTIQAAKHAGVTVGAHPSYPDRENFGRTAMKIEVAELERSLCGQIRLLADVARSERIRVSHVKPHGALYHAANHSAEVAACVARASAAVDPAFVIVAQSGSPALEVYRRMGMRTAAEAFVDRRYERDGTLRDRKLPGALLESAATAAEQAIRIAVDRSVLTAEGVAVPTQADTLCLHSDTPDSVLIAEAVNAALINAGVVVSSLSQE